MTSTHTGSATQQDSELGLHLLVAQGMRWIASSPSLDDPYAPIVLAHTDQRASLYRQVRERGRLYRSFTEAWVTGSYEVAREVVADSRLGVWYADEELAQQPALSLEAPLLSHVLSLDSAFLTLDLAGHERLRGSVDAAVGRDGIATFRAKIDRVCHRILDGVGASFDLANDFARPCAAATLCELTGVPPEWRQRILGLCRDVSIALDATMCPPTFPAATRLITAVDTLRGMFGELVTSKASAEGDDLMGQLLATAQADVSEDVLAACMLLAVVGTEMAATLMCSALLALLGHPQQWSMVRHEPSLVPAALEETLRYEPPVRLESRIAQEELDVAGERIEVGSEVVAVIAAANRDPEVFPAPERFDVTRVADPPNLALAGGLHTSFVAPFVRLQADVALHAVMLRLPGLVRTGDLVHRMRSPVLHALARCPVAMS